MNKLSCLVLLALSGCVCSSDPAATAHRTAVKSGATVAASEPVEASPALALDSLTTLQAMMPGLAGKRVVFIGELHTRYDHHLSELEIIRRLYVPGAPLAIGMEMFQQPFQPALDQYIAGDIDADAMLRATEYYQRWRMDFRLYAPILEFAREHAIPVIALNVPEELVHRVGRVGFNGLSDAEKRQLPADMAPADPAYRERIRTVFDSHPNEGGQSFEDFLDAQLLWDEGMAARAAAYLQEHPERRLVVIAGNQHVAWGSAMPQRLQRRLHVSMASILNSWQGDIAPGLADFLLMPAERELPAGGRIGVEFEQADQGVIITACQRDGACAAVDIRSGDRIAAIDDHGINSGADLRLALWDKRPGDAINLDIVRKHLLLPDQNLNVELTLK